MRGCPPSASCAVTSRVGGSKSCVVRFRQLREAGMKLAAEWPRRGRRERLRRTRRPGGAAISRRSEPVVGQVPRHAGVDFEGRAVAAADPPRGLGSVVGAGPSPALPRCATTCRVQEARRSPNPPRDGTGRPGPGVRRRRWPDPRPPSPARSRRMRRGRPARTSALASVSEAAP